MRAGINECLKYASGTVVGTGLALALTGPQAIPTLIHTLLHAEPPQLAETRWNAVPMPPVIDLPAMPVPPVVDLLQPPAIDTVPGSSLSGPALVGVDEVVRDELMLIERAKRVIKQGEYKEALRYLERHILIYPDGEPSPVRDKLLHRVNQLIGRSTNTSG